MNAAGAQELCLGAVLKIPIVCDVEFPHVRFPQFILRVYSSRTRVLFECVHWRQFIFQRYCVMFDRTHTAALLRSMEGLQVCLQRMPSSIAYVGVMRYRFRVTGSIAMRVGSDMDAAEQTENVTEAFFLDEEIEMKSDEDTVREADEELTEYRTETDEQAGSIVLRVGNDMGVTEQNDTVSEAVCPEDEIEIENKRDEVNGVAAAKKTFETNDGVSKEDVEIRSLIEERRSTSKGKIQRLKDLSKQIKTRTRDKKKQKD